MTRAQDDASRRARIVLALAAVYVAIGRRRGDTGGAGGASPDVAPVNAPVPADVAPPE